MASFDDYRWLMSDEAISWLERVAKVLAGHPPTPSYVRGIRTSLGAERTALVLEQVDLRGKARTKYSQADQLFFTRRGLEQATDEQLAAYKGQRFDSALRVADLCCGIGGDAMALAADHEIIVVDRDEVSLLLATANVQLSGSSFVPSACCENVEAKHVAAADAWHIDPDRRASGQRTSRIELGEPGVDKIDELRASCGSAAIKLAPAAEVPEHWADCEREWIETRGECRQQVAWFGTLAEAPGQHMATLIDAHGEACSFSGAADVPMHSLDQASTFIFDPSPSLVAAQLVGALAAALDLQALSSQSLYLTGQSELFHPHLQAFAVEEVLPLDVRKLRAYLQARRVGRVEIKKRGVDIAPEALRPQLALAGDKAATLILARMGGQSRAIVCRRYPE
jgi:hypothetical protein